MNGILKLAKRVTAISMATLISASIIFASMATWQVAFADQASDETLSKIDAYIEQKMDEGKIPGLSIAIVNGNETILLKGYGKTGNGSVKVEAETPFITGSITKSLTALAIQQLISEGKLNANDSVETFIPEFNILKPDGSKITIGELVTHTSGLATASGDQAFVFKGTYTLETLVSRIIEAETSNFPAGTMYQYSNLNYILLGRIIEIVTGATYDAAIQSQIFEPLGMVQSGFDYVESKKNGLAQGHRVVYGFVSETNYPYPNGLISSSMMMSSATDLAEFLKLSVNNGYFTDKSGAQKSIIADNPLEPITEVSKSDGVSYYDVIWQPQTEYVSNNYNGFAGVISTLPNYNSAMLINYETQTGIVILINQANQYDQPSITAQTIGNDITDLLIGNEPYAFESKSNVSLWLMPLLAVILIFIMFSSFRKTRLMLMDTREKVKILTTGEAFKGLLSLMAYFGFPLFFDNTWGYLTGASPEYALPILIIIVFNLLTVIANFTLKLRANHKRSMRFK